jgi:hypothetical protein
MIRSGNSILEHLDRVSLFDLRNYLNRKGWKQYATNGEKWQVFKLAVDSGPSLELILPGSESFIDIRERIQQSIEALSQIEDKPVSEILSGLIVENADSVKLRLQVPDSVSSLPIDDASRHIKAIRNLFLYSGCSEIRSIPHFEQPLPAAQEYLGDFKFCHTFRGSFGFEISSTIIKEQEDRDLFELPVNRRIVERIARGLIALDSAVRSEDPDILISSYERALNARMCDALAQIGLGGELNFGIGINWATILKPSEDIVSFQGVTIGEAQVSMLSYASEKMKIIEPTEQQISGRVVNLHCVANPSEGSARRTVAIKVDHSEHGPIEVRLALGPVPYLSALKAHSEGNELVASGQLQRKGNTWSLDAITSVQEGQKSNK